MREVKFTDLINKSIERVGPVLFESFSVKKWCKLIVIACLAGAIGGGGCGGGGSHRSDKKAEASPVIVKGQETADEGSVRVITHEKTRRLQTEEDIKKFADDIVNKLMRWPMHVLSAVIFAGTVVISLIILFFMWLSARFKFVWFDAIANNRDAIGEPFRHYQKEGDSIFKLWIAVSLGGILFVALLGLLGYSTVASAGFFKAGAVGTGGAIAALALIAVVFIIVVIGVTIWDVAVEHFVIPIMAMDKITFRRAWQKFWSVYQANAKDFWLYLLVLVGLKIVSWMAEGVVFFAVILAILLAGLLAFGLGYLIFGVLLKAKLLFWVFAIVFGVPAAIAAVVMIIAVGLPFAVFFRNFSLYFLSSLNCGYAPLSLTKPKEIA